MTSGPYLNVANSDISGGTVTPSSYTTVINSGNNTGWSFDTTPPSIPGTPTTTSPTANSRPTWTWTASSDSQSGLASVPYTVEWSKDNTFNSGVSTDTAATDSYTFSSYLADGTWYFRVDATDLVGNTSAWSSYGTVIINTPVPTTPGSTSYSSVLTNSITVSWSSSTDSSGPGLANPAYHVERAVDNSGSPGSFGEVGTTNSTSYIDSSVSPDIKYWYRIRSVDLAGNYSSYNTNSSKSSLTNAPASPNAQASSSVTISPISWSAPSGGATQLSRIFIE